MSRPAALPRPMEPLATASIATKRGTSHTVKVAVSGDKVKLSDKDLHIKNGDAVLWSASGLSTGDSLVIKFGGAVLSARHQGSGASVSVDITEELGDETLWEAYSLAVRKAGATTDTPLTYEGLASLLNEDGPYLVVDDMPKPIGTSPVGGGGDGARHGRRRR